MFATVNSDSFIRYLEEYHPHFFLGSDGTTPWWTNGPQMMLPFDMMYRFNLAGYHVAFFEHLEFKSSRAFLQIGSPRGVQQRLQVYAPSPTPDRSSTEDNVRDRLEELIKKHNLTAREIISLYSLAHVLANRALDASENDGIMPYVKALLLQLVFMRHCSINGRSFELRGSGFAWDSPPTQFICALGEPARRILDSWNSGPFANSAWDAFDLFDGRLYLALLRSSDNMALSSALNQEFTHLGALLEHLCGYNVTANPPAKLTDTDEETRLKNAKRQPGQSVPAFSVLPFSHPIWDEFLTSVHIHTETAISSPVDHKVHKELTHWHNYKKPIDPKQPIKGPDFYARRRNQRFMADIIAYSASLTGASGKIIEPETIVVRSSVEQSKPASKHAGNKVEKQATFNKPLKKSGKQKALEEAEVIREAKFQQKSTSVITFWKARCQEFSKEASPVRRYLRAEKYLRGLSPLHMSMIGAEVSLYLCHILLETQGLYKPDTVTRK